MLQGYKTYIVGIVCLIYGAAMIWFDHPDQGIEAIGFGAGLLGLRGGIATEARLLMSAQNILPPEKATKMSIGQVKETIGNAAARAANAGRRIGPVLALVFITGASLAGCATFGQNPQNDLSIVEDGLATAKVLYNTVCSFNAGAAYCSEASMKLANDAMGLATDAIASARVILSDANSDDAKIQAAIDGARKAVAHFRDIINQLNADKMKALQAKAPMRVSFVDRVRAWFTAPWLAA